MTSPVDTTVKFFNESMVGAPTLIGQSGALIALLDACLVTGFGSRGCTITVLDEVATATVSSNVKNQNLVRSVQLIAGVTGGMTNATNLNGEQRLTEATLTTLKWNCPGVADGTCTGTITIKQAPLGWEKVYTDTNKAVYRASDPSGLRMYLRVLDDSSTVGKVRGYITMTDVDTGTGPFPVLEEYGEAAVLWQKCLATSSVEQIWNLNGDHALFYFSPAPNQYASPAAVGQSTYCFGDILPYRSTDGYHCLLSAIHSNGAGATYGNVWQTGSNYAQCQRMARAITGLGAGVYAYYAPIAGPSAAMSGADSSQVPFPSVSDGSLRVCGMWVTNIANANTSNALYRGELPGLKYVLHSGPMSVHYPRNSVIPLGNRDYIAQMTGGWGSSSGELGLGLIDITGPWRE